MPFFYINNVLNYLSICNISIGFILVLKKLAQLSSEYIENNVPSNFSIFYSTETGNSRKISELFKKLLDEISIEANVREINSILEENMYLNSNNSVFVFVVSTCGNGNFPASSRKFIRYLSKMIKSGNEIFLGTKYTIIGLGSSLYEYSFNSAAFKLDKLISSLKGEKYCEIALLDEVNGNEIDFKTWWNNIFLNRLGISDSKEHLNKHFSIAVTRKKDEFVCKLKSINEISFYNHSLSGNCHVSESYFKLIEFWPINRELLCETKTIDGIERQIFNLKLKLPDKVQYKTFDIIDILPPNLDENIAFFSSKVLGINSIEDLKNITVEFVPINNMRRNISVPFPNNRSLMHILKYYFDLMTLPPHSVMLQFVPYLNSIEGELISNESFFNENKDPYEFSFHLFINRFMKSLIPIPIEKFVKFTGIRQYPRSYSISSSSLASPSMIDLTISTCIKGQIPAPLNEIISEGANRKNSKKIIKGLCSSFLFEFDLNSPVLGMIRSSSLNIDNVASSALMFSHGSGIAPIRALLHERKYLINEKKIIKPAYLFYGCRTENEIIYKDELKDFKRIGALTEVFFALSKTQKKYVKDIIPFYKHIILKVVDQNDSIIYICGKKEFVSGIKNEVASIISNNRSRNIIKKMFVEGRIFIESWN
ncbi:NADPH-cytochrome p450 reductase [Cryptosporidium hominis]|uniref:NADPH--hemoprotein reductase n=1 Tax=Cryptosporidium hominis TaxID=237895 RepID=A0ABX5BH60_CRYHO|nr:nitric-oxide synthase (NOS) [Cryptosporidium hominis TU502]PPS96324.1 NADPH-cytochrome p450 reductase [Cryptosporidium hominis]|eukprot:PPS96324.1 NADPH-cytochrome p450 reductase [Cryptosporidium hominis]